MKQDFLLLFYLLLIEKRLQLLIDGNLLKPMDILLNNWDQLMVVEVLQNLDNLEEQNMRLLMPWRGINLLMMLIIWIMVLVLTLIICGIGMLVWLLLLKVLHLPLFHGFIKLRLLIIVEYMKEQV